MDYKLREKKRLRISLRKGLEIRILFMFPSCLSFQTLRTTIILTRYKNLNQD